MANSALASLLFKKNQISAIKWFCIAVAICSTCSETMLQSLQKVSSFDAAVSTKYATNLATSVFVLGLYFVTASNPLTINTSTIAFACAFALFVDVVPGLLSRLAGLLIKDNSIYALWALAPITGAGALSLMNSTTIDPVLAIAGLLIIGSNIALSILK